METYKLIKSPRSAKKWRITTPTGKNVDFGASGYSDYTLHKDPSRQSNYLSRHEARENWTKSGIDTAGFWSRWLLWNLPDLEESIKDIENRFDIVIDRSEVNTEKKVAVTLKSAEIMANNNNAVAGPDYYECLEDAKKRKEQGKLKLCPEGYCTAKLTSDVYPSYWANLKASKICKGTEEDMEGKVKNYYES